MKVSLCCGKVPLELTSGLNSEDLGLCPKCGEHTEFVDLIFKVNHEYGEDFITTKIREAREYFDGYKEDRCDRIRLYQGMATSDDADEIEWELIDSYDAGDEEDEKIPLENYEIEQIF